MPDVGLTGSPAAVAAALTAHGFQINADNTTTLTDPALNAAGLTVTGYRVIDGVAYVLVRTPASIPLPAGLSVVPPGLRAAITGEFEADTMPPPPTVISVNQWFNRFTAAEKTFIRANLATHPAWGTAIVGWALSDGVDLLAPATATAVDVLIAGGGVAAARKVVILTP
jgi:hypothetical protein